MSAYCMFDLSVSYLFLQYCDTVGWVFWPVKTVSHITHILCGRVRKTLLNPIQSIALCQCKPTLSLSNSTTSAVVIKRLVFCWRFALYCLCVCMCNVKLATVRILFLRVLFQPKATVASVVLPWTSRQCLKLIRLLHEQRPMTSSVMPGLFTRFWRVIPLQTDRHH